MKLDSPRKIVKVLRLYIEVGDELLKHLAYTDPYDMLHACAIGNTVKKGTNRSIGKDNSS